MSGPSRACSTVWTRLLLALAAALALVLNAPGASVAGAPSEEPVGEWPLQPQPSIAAYFEPPPHPYGAGHRGVDLVGRPGQAVRSALPGRVRFAGQVAGRPVVVVGHGQTRTTYQPVIASVEVGDEVAAADVIGTLSAAGSHCAPRACLHWGWLRGEEYLDPLGLVGYAPIRLLPLWTSSPVSPTRARPPTVGWTPPHAAWCQARGWAC